MPYRLHSDISPHAHPPSPRYASQLIPLGKKDTQLEDQCEIKYNEKYKAWIPSDQDPDEWAKENLSAPPPPPTGGAAHGSNGTSDADVPKLNGLGGPAPQTPMAGGGGFSGADPARFSPRSSARRNPRSRYVDTFNAIAGDGEAPGSTTTLPAARSRPPVKIFTPSATPSGGEDAGPKYERPSLATPAEAPVDTDSASARPQ